MVRDVGNGSALRGNLKRAHVTLDGPFAMCRGNPRGTRMHCGFPGSLGLHPPRRPRFVLAAKVGAAALQYREFRARLPCLSRGARCSPIEVSGAVV